jgi:hypothetical protein
VAGDVVVSLPSGQTVRMPTAPRTWVEKSGATRGDPLRGKHLERDVSAAVAFHRNRPLFQGIRTTALSVPNSTFTTVPLDTELVDTHAGHSDVSNTSRWSVPHTANTTDWYLCTGYVPYVATTAATVHYAALRVNGGTTLEGMKIAGNTGHQTVPMVVDLLELNGDFLGATDYVELIARQNSGGAVNTVASGKTPSLTIRWACSGTESTAALPSPRTWTAADLLTATTSGGANVPLNTHIRDVCRFLNYPPTAKITSEGTTQTITTGTSYTSIQMTAEPFDNYGGHSNVTNNTRYTFQRAGLYFVSGLASISEGDGGSSGNGYRSCRLLQTIAAGGTKAFHGATVLPPTSGTIGTAIHATTMMRAAVGDYVELQVSQTQSSGTTTRTVANGAGNSSRLIAVWMSL